MSPHRDIRSEEAKRLLSTGAATISTLLVRYPAFIRLVVWHRIKSLQKSHNSIIHLRFIAYRLQNANPYPEKENSKQNST